MPPIPASIALYAPVLLALAAGAAACWFGRAKGRAGWVRPGLAASCLLGWAALEPLGRLRAAIFLPPLAPALLILPAALVAAVELVRTRRGGRNDRMLSVLAALLTGWWLARTAAGPAEFWRVAIVTAALTGLLALLVRRNAGRAFAAALALTGTLAVAGFPPPWLVAAAVTAAATAAPFLLRAPALVPSALLAATVAGADLARGRLPRGHLDGADIACLLALAAPLLAAAAEPRLPKAGRPFAPLLAAALAVALGWGLRRISF